MSSDAGSADYMCECLSLSCSGKVSCKKLFGEYALYYNGKVIGLVCDNKLFIKPTEFGKKLLSESNSLKLKAPYDGAKMWFLIENFENRELMEKLILGMFDELPWPKPKRKKTSSSHRKKTFSSKLPLITPMFDDFEMRGQND